MEYPAIDLDDLIRAWTISVMFKDCVGILKPRSMSIENKQMICDPWDGNLSDNIELITNDTREIYVNHFMQGLSAMSKKGVVHKDLTPRNIYLCKEPPSLVISGLHKCHMNTTGDNWEVSSIIICLYLLRSTGREIRIRDIESPRDSMIKFTHPTVPEDIMKIIYQQLTETVSIFVANVEKRKEVLNNTYTLFYNAMSSPNSDISMAKKCIMFSLYISLNLSGEKIEYSIVPDDDMGINNIEWYNTFISPL